MKKKLIRVTTVPISLSKLLQRQLSFINKFYDVTVISSKKEELLKVAVDESNVFTIYSFWYGINV